LLYSRVGARAVAGAAALQHWLLLLVAINFSSKKLETHAYKTAYNTPFPLYVNLKSLKVDVKNQGHVHLAVSPISLKELLLINDKHPDITNKWSRRPPLYIVVVVCNLFWGKENNQN
jgi:hypothetical protein